MLPVEWNTTHTPKNTQQHLLANSPLVHFTKQFRTIFPSYLYQKNPKPLSEIHTAPGLDTVAFFFVVPVITPIIPYVTFLQYLFALGPRFVHTLGNSTEVRFAGKHL